MAATVTSTKMDNPNIESAGVDAGAKIFVGLMRAAFPSVASLPMKSLEASVLLGFQGISRRFVGQDGILRPIGNRPSEPSTKTSTGRIPSDRKMPSCPTERLPSGKTFAKHFSPNNRSDRALLMGEDCEQL